ncbi:TPA: hypothetical protein MCT25_004672 [Klebsiella pneumoniae]|nr:hypothetical protein [Klebsiella pneumoniae]HBU2134149.1 hypothetical protein [Klebsiella pneumoniae]HBU2294388.1 hypothetical protein [Klebsiella pneumoniae]HBU3382069.1 hypothetical protein [Klebsiella pneumoniae]
MNNTLQLFWSGGLHIAKIFMLNKKNIQLKQKKEEPKKYHIADQNVSILAFLFHRPFLLNPGSALQFLVVFPLFHPYRSIQFINQHFILS